MKNILPLSGEDFSLFQELLIETSGLFFEESRNQSLQFALCQRLQHRGYDSYREYYNLLKFHPEGRLEIRELLDLITIGETYFFRNKAQFDVLMKFVLPEIMQRKIDSGDKWLRVWSAGCSGGDETYSIAMAMTEVVPSHEDWRISILGTDINRNVLASAKKAIYNEKHIGHLPKEYVAKYFKVGDTTYALNAGVRELARFEYHNLAKDPFIHERMQNIDIIFCRNVMIYFDSQTTQRVIENFYNCLAQDGYLFLGHAETLWQITNKFERVEFPQTFIYKKRLSPFQEDTPKPFIAVPGIEGGDFAFPATPTVASCQYDSPPVFEAQGKNPSSGQPLSKPRSAGGDAEGSAFIKEADLERSFFCRELGPGLLKKPESLEGHSRLPDVEKQADSAYRQGSLDLEEREGKLPLSSPDQPRKQRKNGMGSHLTKATILANEAKYKEATDVLQKLLEVDNLSVEAYYLLGVLSYKSSNLTEAEIQFRKVIYVDPDSVIAYFNLGNMYLYQRKFGEAAREFRNAIRLLEKRSKDEQIRFCEDFTVEFLLRACRKSLVEISKRGE
ncbi:MAG TPA: CheR family methyltransferase [Thermodesulfobacteriota bacterium]|nr:CheR family methyltransferase [Thermodesulfobacteriota bacterium]